MPHARWNLQAKTPFSRTKIMSRTLHAFFIVEDFGETATYNKDCLGAVLMTMNGDLCTCLLYTSDAADD